MSTLSDVSHFFAPSLKVTHNNVSWQLSFGFVSTMEKSFVSQLITFTCVSSNDESVHFRISWRTDVARSMCKSAPVTNQKLWSVCALLTSEGPHRFAWNTSDKRDCRGHDRKISSMHSSLIFHSKLRQKCRFFLFYLFRFKLIKSPLNYLRGLDMRQLNGQL